MVELMDHKERIEQMGDIQLVEVLKHKQVQLL